MRLSSITCCSCGAHKSLLSLASADADAEFPAEVMEEGTKLIEQLLAEWSASQLDDGEDIAMAGADDDDTEVQLQELRKCMDKYRPQLEANPWVRHVLQSLS